MNNLGIQGQAAPEFRVPMWMTTDGEPAPEVKLADISEPFIYLYNFQSWCPGCHSHGFPTLKALQEGLAERGLADKVHFTVVQTLFEGHDQNTAETAVESLKRHDITGVDLGHDSGEPPTIMADYRTGGTPWAVIIGPPQGPDGQRPVLANDFRVDAEVLLDSFEKLLRPAEA